MSQCLIYCPVVQSDDRLSAINPRCISLLSCATPAVSAESQPPMSVPQPRPAGPTTTEAVLAPCSCGRFRRRRRRRRHAAMPPRSSLTHDTLNPRSQGRAEPQPRGGGSSAIRAEGPAQGDFGRFRCASPRRLGLRVPAAMRMRGVDHGSKGRGRPWTGRSVTIIVCHHDSSVTICHHVTVPSAAAPSTAPGPATSGVRQRSRRAPCGRAAAPAARPVGTHAAARPARRG